MSFYPEENTGIDKYTLKFEQFALENPTDIF